MVPFDLTIELNDMPATLQVEPFDRIADENALPPYDVGPVGRQPIVSADVEDYFQSDEFTFEALHAKDESFIVDEPYVMIKAIRGHDGLLLFPRNYLPFNN
jgi:hypothetical protein